MTRAPRSDRCPQTASVDDAVWTGTRAVALGRALLALLVLLSATTGAGFAGEERPHGPCPGENPNQGLENANDRGIENSAGGIGRAASAIECPTLPAE